MMIKPEMDDYGKKVHRIGFWRAEEGELLDWGGGKGLVRWVGDVGTELVSLEELHWGTYRARRPNLPFT